MKPVETLRIAALFCLSSAFSFAASWSGVLVDSKCYDAEERNVSPTDTLTNVDRDRNLEIRYCSPGAKTKSFGVVASTGEILHFDSVGSAKAEELVRKTGKRHLLPVAVTGEMIKDAIQVD